MNLHPLKTAVPQSIRQQLNNSIISYLYEELQQTVKQETRTVVDTPAGPISIKVYDTWRYLDENDSRIIYEPVLMDDLTKRFNSESVFYDIGSRWGIFTALAVQAGVKPKNIHGLEAEKSSFELLQKNHLGEKINLTKGVVGEAEPEIILDDYFAQHSKPTLIKIDIEGAEARALRGASNLLSSEQLALFIEIHPEYLCEMGDSQEEVFDILYSNGFNLHVCLDNRGESHSWYSPDEIELPTQGDYLLRGTAEIS